MHRFPLAAFVLMLALPAAAQQVQQLPQRDPNVPDSTASEGLKQPAVKNPSEGVQPPAMKPSRGKNSFTEDQARTRIEKRGYSDVGSLQKDSDDVWHAHAKKGGRDVTVALDWMGNVIEGR